MSLAGILGATAGGLVLVVALQAWLLKRAHAKLGGARETIRTLTATVAALKRQRADAARPALSPDEFRRMPKDPTAP